MKPTSNASRLYRELGEGMEAEVAELNRAGYRLTLLSESNDDLWISCIRVQRDLSGSNLFRATFHYSGTLDVRLGSPVDDAAVRRYRASETDYVWRTMSDNDDHEAGPYTSQALANAWGRELRELLASLNPPIAHPGAIVTKEE